MDSNWLSKHEGRYKPLLNESRRRQGSFLTADQSRCLAPIGARPGLITVSCQQAIKSRADGTTCVHSHTKKKRKKKARLVQSTEENESGCFVDCGFYCVYTQQVNSPSARLEERLNTQRHFFNPIKNQRVQNPQVLIFTYSISRLNRTETKDSVSFSLFYRTSAMLTMLMMLTWQSWWCVMSPSVFIEVFIFNVINVSVANQGFCFLFFIEIIPLVHV